MKVPIIYLSLLSVDVRPHKKFFYNQLAVHCLYIYQLVLLEPKDKSWRNR